MHPYPPPPHMSARSPSATRVAPAPQPGQERRPPLSHTERVLPQQAPAAPAPVELRRARGDDWDGETVVKQPAALTTSKHRERPGREAPRAPAQSSHAAAPPQKPFNPDETVNLKATSTSTSSSPTRRSTSLRLRADRADQAGSVSPAASVSHLLLGDAPSPRISSPDRASSCRSSRRRRGSVVSFFTESWMVGAGRAQERVHVLALAREHARHAERLSDSGPSRRDLLARLRPTDVARERASRMHARARHRPSGRATTLSTILRAEAVDAPDVLADLLLRPREQASASVRATSATCRPATCPICGMPSPPTSRSSVRSLRRLDRLDHVLRALLPHALEARDLLRGRGRRDRRRPSRAPSSTSCSTSDSPR